MEQTTPYTGHSCTGTLTPMLTWTADNNETLPPAPAQVSVLLTITCTANGTAYASDSLHDHFAVNGTPVCAGTFSHLITMSISAAPPTATLPAVRISVPGTSLVSSQELTLGTGTDGGVHFSSWSAPTYTVHQIIHTRGYESNQDTDTTTTQTTSPAGAGAGIYCTPNSIGSATICATITATWTWQPNGGNLQADPAPATATVLESSQSYWHVPNAACLAAVSVSLADDGMNDPDVNNPAVYPDGSTAGVGRASSGQHLTLLTTHAGTVSVTHTLRVRMAFTTTSGATFSTIPACAYQLVVGGGNLQAYSTADTANWDPTHPRFFSGTACTATATAAALSGILTHAQLCIGENGSDTVVKEYWDTAQAGKPAVLPLDNSVIVGNQQQNTLLSALFDSTHFMDKAKIGIKLKVWDSSGSYYEANLAAVAYNWAFVLANRGQLFPNTNPPQYIGDDDNNFGIYPDVPDYVVQSISNHLRSMKHSIAPSPVEQQNDIAATTYRKPEILANILLFSTFYIYTHGNPGIFGDCTTNAGNMTKSNGVFASEIGNLISGRNTQNLPPFNFVHIDGCATAGYEPNVDTTLAQAFVVNARRDAAFLGYMNEAVSDEPTRQFSQRIWQNLANQQTLFDAVNNSLVHGRPSKDDFILDANGYKATTKIKIIGDSSMRLHGIYTGVPGNWFKSL